MKYDMFKVLRYLIENNGSVSQRKMSKSKSVNLSLGKVNSLVNEAIKEGYISAEYIPTKKCLQEFEKYKINNCVIFAAGFGSRMRPLTLHTPKPLVKVHGVPMIETVMNSAYKKGIRDFVIVVGYLSSQFNYLKDKYTDCNITYVENKDYNVCNNISSFNVAKDYVDRSYICEADLVVSEKAEVFHQYEFRNFYCGLKEEGQIDDWVFTEKRKKQIKNLHLGGFNNYKMVGISYFDKESALGMRKKVTEVLERTPLAKDWYWDYIPIREMDFDVFIRDLEQGDVFEIDNVQELIAIDPSYKKVKGLQ